MSNWIREVNSKKGGAGSGNFNHRGREGQVGGSSPIAMKNISASHKLAEETNPIAKECWKNSVMAMGLLSGSVYVEGYHVTLIGDDFKFPIEHGWLEYDGEVIDVTLPDSIGEYYPAIRFTQDEVHGLVSGSDNVWLPFTNYADRKMQKAMEAAHRDAFGSELKGLSNE